MTSCVSCLTEQSHEGHEHFLASVRSQGRRVLAGVLQLNRVARNIWRHCGRSVTMMLSSCETFTGFTASLSLGKVSADCLADPQKFGALRPRGSGEPAGEYLPPSTHRLFSVRSRVLSLTFQAASRQRALSLESIPPEYPPTRFRRLCAGFSRPRRACFRLARHCVR